MFDYLSGYLYSIYFTHNFAYALIILLATVLAGVSAETVTKVLAAKNEKSTGL
ncbi:MAG: hypothetical protein ACOY30_07815 [Bacillota bacterium]